MNLKHTSGVAIPQDCREIMRLVDLIHQDRQVRLAA